MTCYFFRNLAIIWYLSLIDTFNHSAIFFDFQRLSKVTSLDFLSPGHKSSYSFHLNSFQLPEFLMDCFLWDFFKTCLCLSSILLTHSFFWCCAGSRRQECIWLLTLNGSLLPNTPEATLLLRSDVKTALRQSVPWASKNVWHFKSLLLKGSELSTAMIQVHQVLLKMYGGGQTVLLRQQKSSTMWMHAAHISHAMANRPAHIAWKWAAHSLTTCFSFLWLLSIFWRWKRRQRALHDLAFPVSWSNHGTHWRFATYQI